MRAARVPAWRASARAPPRSDVFSGDLRTMRLLLSNFYDMLGVAVRTLEAFAPEG